MGGDLVHRAPDARHGTGAPNSLSLPWVIGASLLMGIGLFLISVWIVTFNNVFLVGIFVVLIGALMILSPRMGSDHA